VKYLLTVTDEEGVAVDVLYCGRSWLLARGAWDSALSLPRLRGRQIRMLTSTDEGEVVKTIVTQVR
jgi:hypothetical protein